MTQQGDVLLFQTTDDGEINVTGGLVEMTGGLDTSVYLSLFGGNQDDDTGQGSTRQWWGNIDETEQSRVYRSETQYLLPILLPIPASLNRLQDAGLRDLNWLLEENIASTVEVEATIPEVDKVMLVVIVEADGVEQRFEYTENWKATA